jgi:hypothetical protein
MLLRALLVWLLLVALAVLNGALREALLAPRLGAPAGHVASTLSLAALILLVAWHTIRWIAPGSGRRAWAVGLLWLFLTLAFEVLAGHYLLGHPWPALLADYDLRRGRVWPLVLLATLVAPPGAWRGREVVTGGEAGAAGCRVRPRRGRPGRAGGRPRSGRRPPPG